VRAPCEALLGEGHAVHLGLTGDADARTLTTLWNAWPQLSIGHAVPRRDRWARLAGRLDASMARGLPADPGITAYLGQLDLDLLLLGAPAEPRSIEAEYVSACGELGLPAAVIGPTPEAALAQARPGAVAAPRPEPTLFKPLLWTMWLLDEIGHPAPPDAAADRDGRSLSRRIEDGYADRIFPGVAQAAASLAPSGRPLVKAELADRLDRSSLANALSAERAVAEAAEGSGMVAIGPWWDDPDLEILYWAPFVRWWRRRYQVDKERLVVVSGGGSGHWYEGALGQRLDLAELYDPQALADLIRGRDQELAGRRKRFGVTDADRQVIKRLNRRLGFRGLKVLAPWVMGVAFERYWSGEAGPALLAGRTRAQGLRMKDKRARQIVPGLPPSFVAVGLPGRLAAEADLRMGLKTLVRRAADRTEVVLLAEPACAEWARGIAGGKVHVIELDPASAKATVSAVSAAATACLGPAGWMAYVAAAYGRPSICLHAGSDERELIDLAAASRLFSPAPLVIGLADLDAAAAALELAVLRAGSAAPAH
jgi:hypothetical protein